MFVLFTGFLGDVFFFQSEMYFLAGEHGLCSVWWQIIFVTIFYFHKMFSMEAGEIVQRL